MSQKYTNSSVYVIREGEELEIPIKDVVVGDLLFMMSG